ncbi:MAG: alpha/beta hydrolase, partial [Bradyrhizobium sp.]|uniref:alpha/beta fold hydrolase n=1 Tax=Bradyrhizobium sp. TaxID=376 RepID=UPI001DFF8ACF
GSCLAETEASTRNLERFIADFDNRQTVAVAPLLRQLQAPTLIVWGTADDFFPLKWAYWLQGAIPGACDVIEFDGAKPFFPWERPEGFAGVVRKFWQSSSRRSARLALEVQSAAARPMNMASKEMRRLLRRRHTRSSIMQGTG